MLVQVLWFTKDWFQIYQVGAANRIPWRRMNVRTYSTSENVDEQYKSAHVCVDNPQFRVCLGLRFTRIRFTCVLTHVFRTREQYTHTHTHHMCPRTLLVLLCFGVSAWNVGRCRACISINMLRYLSEYFGNMPQCVCVSVDVLCDNAAFRYICAVANGILCMCICVCVCV